MTDDEFIKEMLEKYNRNDMDDHESITRWLKDFKDYSTNQLTEMMDGKHLLVDHTFRFMIARELASRLTNDCDRLELVLLVGEYLLE